jgi:hypothetical protein
MFEPQASREDSPPNGLELSGPARIHSDYRAGPGRVRSSEWLAGAGPNEGGLLGASRSTVW